MYTYDDLVKYVLLDFGKCHFAAVGKAHSTLNVSSTEYSMPLSSTCPPSPAFSSITLTPGRIRNIDQDMEALRISRQDNPFLQVIPPYSCFSIYY